MLAKNWSRRLRKEKIFILGSRSGTTLVHKCLLLTGLLNWGTWSLHHFDSEAPIKLKIWSQYPNIKWNRFFPKYKFEIAKAPEFALVIDKLEEVYPNSKYIVLERPIKEKVASHIKAWGFRNLWDFIPNWKRELSKEYGYYPPTNYDLLTVNMTRRDRKQAESLAKIPEERKLYIQFDDLMVEFLLNMTRICNFIDIPIKNYVHLWVAMRGIKHMSTGSM